MKGWTPGQLFECYSHLHCVDIWVVHNSIELVVCGLCIWWRADTVYTSNNLLLDMWYSFMLLRRVCLLRIIYIFTHHLVFSNHLTCFPPSGPGGCRQRSERASLRHGPDLWLRGRGLPGRQPQLHRFRQLWRRSGLRLPQRLGTTL